MHAAGPPPDRVAPRLFALGPRALLQARRRRAAPFALGTFASDPGPGGAPGSEAVPPAEPRPRAHRRGPKLSGRGRRGARAALRGAGRARAAGPAAARLDAAVIQRELAGPESR